MFLSKMTAATLEDIEYIVDASMVRLGTENVAVTSYVRSQQTMPATQLPLEAMLTYATESNFLAAKTVGGTTTLNSDVRVLYNARLCGLDSKADGLTVRRGS